jgi:hypothetical protein
VEEKARQLADFFNGELISLSDDQQGDRETTAVRTPDAA